MNEHYPRVMAVDRINFGIMIFEPYLKNDEKEMNDGKNGKKFE
jgi:hypothetical protein